MARGKSLDDLTSELLQMSTAEIVTFVEMGELSSADICCIREILQDRFNELQNELRRCEEHATESVGATTRFLNAHSGDGSIEIDPGVDSCVGTPSFSSNQIDVAYAVVGELAAARIQHPDNPDLSERFNKAFTELRRVQTELASEIEVQVLASLALPLDEGTKAIAEAKEVMAKYADSPLTNSDSE